MKCLQGTFKKREEILEFVSGLEKSELHQSEENIYKFKHTYDIELDDEIYVKSTLLPEVLDILTAFILYKGFEFNEDVDLGQENIVPILCDLYGCERVEKSKYHREFDLYEVWEKWCGLAGQVLNTEILNHSLLEDKLKEILL